MYKALTVAGADPSGGAGIQADLKTFTALKVYGMSVLTAVTAQNTCGVYAVLNITADMVKAQLDAVFTDIFPDAVKIGMVSTVSIIDAIAEKLELYRPKNVVLDTVMVSTSRHRLLDREAEQHLIERLLPLAEMITPNIPEAEVLCGFSITGKTEMIKAAEQIAKNYAGGILIKGGHLQDSCDDLLYQGGSLQWFTGKRINTQNTHGTGCTLSSAIAAGLAMGKDLPVAVKDAKAYVAGALAQNLNLGRGNGPIDHCYCI